MWRHISINSTRLQPFPTPQAQPANAELQCCKVQASEACRFSDEALASCSGYSRAGLVGHKPIDPLATQLLLENNWPRVPVEQSGEASDMMLTGSVPARRRFELIRLAQRQGQLSVAKLSAQFWSLRRHDSTGSRLTLSGRFCPTNPWMHLIGRLSPANCT